MDMGALETQAGMSWKNVLPPWTELRLLSPSLQEWLLLMPFANCSSQEIISFPWMISTGEQTRNFCLNFSTSYPKPHKLHHTQMAFFSFSRYFRQVATSMSMEVSFVDLTDPKNAVTALKPNTKLVLKSH